MTDPSIVIHIPGKPRTKENSYRTTKGSKRLYVPTELAKWEAEVHQLAIDAMKEAGWPGPWTGRITLGMDITYQTWHETDITNFWKSVNDALNGAVWSDDSQIDRTFQVRQKSSEAPNMTLYVWFHDFDFNDFGKKKPTEWNDFKCSDFKFPDVTKIVRKPSDCIDTTRYSPYGDGRKAEERANARNKRKQSRQAPKKRKANGGSR